MSFNAEKPISREAPVGPARRAGRVDAASSPRRVKIVDVVHVNTATPEAFEGRRRYISTGAIDVDHIDESGVELWGFEDRPSRANLAPDVGDVLFAKMQATRKTYVVCNSEKGSLFSTGFYALKPHAEILDNGYLWHFLNSDQFLNAKDKECHGVTQKALNGAGLSKLTIPLPPLPAQRAIAAELDRICELKRTAEKLVEKYQLLVKSRFVEMFGEGRQECRPNVGAAFLPPQKEKFPTIKLEEATERVKVAFVGSCDKFYTDSEHGVPMVRTTNLTAHGYSDAGLKYVTREFHERNKKSQLHCGDVLVARHGENGRACLYTGGEANCLNVIIVVPNVQMAIPVYLEHVLNSRIVRDQIQRDLVGSTQHVLNTSGLAKVEIPLPPLSLQREFAAFVEKVDKLEFDAKQVAEKLDMLYRSKLQEYFG